MLSPTFYRAKFEVAKTYEMYVATGTPAQRDNWSRIDGQLALTAAQRSLLAAFSRNINILCLSGIWCGDCVAQCPMLRHIAAANASRIDLRFLDRDEHKDLSEPLMICGGLRVPTVIFLNEDFEFVSLLGDRTLNRYRVLASRQLGPSCPLPGAPVPAADLIPTLQDWIDETERVHLLLRLSPKLRQRHGD